MFRKNIMKALPSLLTLVLVLGFFSCNTDDEPQAELSGDSSSALSAELSGDDYFNTVEELSLSAITTSSDGRISISGDSSLNCATLSFNGTFDDGTLTVDFGSGGCTGPDGREKKGMIIISFSGSLEKPGASATITLDGFSVDGIGIEGSWTFTTKTISMDALSFETVLTGGKVTWPNGASATRESTRTYKVTFDVDSDVSIAIEGTASGTTTTGLSYSSVITEPLMFNSDCAVSQSSRIPVQGVLEITSDKTGFSRVIVNFGSGECDETFTVTVGPFTKEMTPGDIESFI